jgi:hypothetical protein
MSKADGGLRAIMVKELRTLGGHFQPIETGMIVSGVLDFNYCINGREGWVECKRTSAWAVVVDGAQVGWADQRVRNGGRVYLAVRRLNVGGARTAPCDELWLCRASAMRKLVMPKTGLDKLAPDDLVGMWRGGPANWDWPAVAKALQI